MKKIVIALIIALAIIGFFAAGLNQYLSLDYLQQNRDRFLALYEQYPWQIAAGFFALYALVTALSLPGATIMTLAGGALFGLVTGFILISFASTIGATLAFLASRYLFRDAIQNRFSKQLKSINNGITREGSFYLFGLRLVPIFPFFLVNLVMGLTPMRTLSFYVVSQLGMIPGTAVYVNAGTQLGQLESLSGILSLELLLSFALLGIVPLISKIMLNRLRRRAIYKGWKRPKKYDRNMVVIGAGAAGLVSSYIAAAVKAKVTLVEAGKMGGDCLNYGCVPSKALIKSATLAHQMRHADKYGLNNQDVKIPFGKVMARVHDVVGEVEPHDSVERYEGLGVEVLQGYAKIVDPWTVEVALNDGSIQTLTTRSIVIGTGARPFVPPLPGLDDIGYLTSDTLWEELAKLEEIPARTLILGGGPIGCELSQSFGRLGSVVTQIEMSPRVLVREDKDVSEYAEQALKESGVEVLTHHRALRCEKEGDQKYIVVEDDGTETRIAFDVLIVAVGRAARLKGFGLEELGIPTERTITTNEYLETNYPNIFAAGDVAGPYQFTHTASHQAWYASVNALFGHLKKFKVDYSVIPWTTFLDPEIARVGLNEQEAEQQEISVEVTKFDLKELDRAIADSAAHGFVKVLTEPGKDKILGVTIVGVHAGDLLAEFVLAMKHGLGLNKIMGTIHTYPTLAEANKYAASEWKKRHAPEGLLKWVKKYHTWRRG